PSIVTNSCFNSASANPAFSADNEWCQRFSRSPTTGEIVDLLELQENIGGLRTDGVDLQLDWNGDIGRHELGFNWLSTYVFESSEASQPGEPFIDYVGSIGDDVGEARGDFRAVFTTRWALADWSAAVRLRYLPSMI